MCSYQIERNEMEDDSYNLACRCKSASAIWGQVAAPPLNSSQLAKSCEHIDGDLPELLIDLYQTIGNGGFGPQGGLLGLSDGHIGDDSQMTADELYHELIWGESPLAWDWPGALLPIAEGGCGLIYCLDIDSTDSDLRLFDPNGLEAEDNLLEFIQDCNTTLSCWLDEWSRSRPPNWSHGRRRCSQAGWG